MARIHVLTIGVAGLLAASAGVAEAQFGRGTPRQGACFYKDANYRGAYFCADAGEELESMPSGANDEISSIRIFGGAEVVVYESRRFRGNSRTFTRDVANLERERLNDKISSVRVLGRSFTGGRPPFGGGGNSPERIIRRAYQDLLGREPNAAGMRQYRSRMIDDGWTEAQVRESIRSSPEYREKHTMTPAKAQDIVARAYRNVLRREPDPGSRTYVQRVLRDGWTQQDVERELRKSPEYRNRR